MCLRSSADQLSLSKRQQNVSMVIIVGDMHAATAKMVLYLVLVFVLQLYEAALPHFMVVGLVQGLRGFCQPAETTP